MVIYFCNIFLITEHTNLFEWWYVPFYTQRGWYIFIFIFDAWPTRSRFNIEHACKFFLDWLHVSAGLQLKTWFIQSCLLGGGWMWHCGITRALSVWCGTARTTWMQMKWCQLVIKWTFIMIEIRGCIVLGTELELIWFFFCNIRLQIAWLFSWWFAEIYPFWAPIIFSDVTRIGSIRFNQPIPGWFRDILQFFLQLFNSFLQLRTLKCSYKTIILYRKHISFVQNSLVHGSFKNWQ